MKTSRCTAPGLPTAAFDVAVIGAGVVGCAIARSFAVRGWRVVVLEKAADILEGASKGNSALLHTGYDEPEGSDELRILRHGLRPLPPHPRPHEPAAGRDRRARRRLVRRGQRARSPRSATSPTATAPPTPASSSADELFEREPQLDRDARGAVLIPGEAIIDPWSAPLAYITQAVRHGARLVTGAELHAAGALGFGLAARHRGRRASRPGSS